MAQEKEKLRAFIEAYNRHDFDDALAYLHPEVEVFPAIGGQLDVSRHYRGRDEVRHLLETISEDGANNVAIEDAIEAGKGQVLQIERWAARGRQGIEFPTEIDTIYTFRDGLVVRVEGFRDRAEALEAAGLEE